MRFYVILRFFARFVTSFSIVVFFFFVRVVLEMLDLSVDSATFGRSDVRVLFDGHLVRMSLLRQESCPVTLCHFY